MKKNLKKYRFLITGIIIIVFLLSLLVISFNGNLKEDGDYNQYKISSEKKEIPGTEIITSETLSSEHCNGDICVSDLVIHNNNGLGRAEYTVTNKGNMEASGYLKLNFGDKSITIFYQNVAPSKSTKNISQFNNLDFSGVTDYSLDELSKEEKDKIKVQ
jgi:hypothetical protein